MTKKSTKISLFLLTLISANLCLSVFVVQALDINGSVTITGCTSNCLNLSVPELTVNNGQLLSPDGGEILVISNYPLGEHSAVEVSDLRTTGGFNVSLDITPLIHSSTTPPSQIDISSIGVLSFNENENEAISTDNAYNVTTVISHIDPDFDDLDTNNLTRAEILANYQNHPEWFQSFPLSSIILEAPYRDPGYKDVFKMGIAFLINTPPSPQLTLRDGIYTMTMTYTLTS